MKKLAMNILAVPGLLAVAAAANAQAPSEAGTAATTNQGAEFELEEVIVTARRRSESLQEVPSSISAVSGETIEKLVILKFEDVAAVVPGLSLNSGLGAPGGAAGSATSVAMRGVSFSPDSQTSASVEFYMNDALIESNILFQSMFDVGQIEVLRGPQGTLRGRSAPSGAITITTRKPDLTEMGGYVSLTGTDLDASNAQGAISVPLIAERLAIRVAAIDDRNEGDGVKSVHSNVDPSNDTQAARVSLRFEPTDSIAADLMYQHMERNQKTFSNVFGRGGPGGTGRPPAGYNGPVIGVGDRLGVSDIPFDIDLEFDVTTANVGWAFAGQKLTYVGSYAESTFDTRQPEDVDNILPNRDVTRVRRTLSRQITHELRLASEEMVAGFFDYTVGAFYSDTTIPTHFTQVAAFLPGTFGSPLAAPNLAIFDSRYQLNSVAYNLITQEESSVFANVTLHLGDRTELALGGRYIHFEADSFVHIDLPRAISAAAVPAPCAVVPGAVGSTYPGTCDFPVVQTRPDLIAPHRDEKPFVYNASLSYHLTDDLLVYASTGTAWRKGPYAFGINNAQNDPNVESVIDIEPEESTSYEIGFKSTFWDNRARVNVAVYHQDYDGLIFATAPRPYISCTTTTTCTINPASPFIASADSVVDGIDVDTNFILTERWTLGLGAGYSDGHVDDDLIPCTPPNFNPASPQASQFPTGNLYLCESSQSVSRLPPWTATLQTEYTMPITQSFDGYVRGVYTHNGENKDRSANFVVSQYGLLNVFAGIRSPNGNWEVSAFVKNALDKEEQLSLDPSVTLAAAAAYFGSSGYQQTSYTPRQEFGLSVRYSFGSF